MRERPILFSAPMVRAILAGRKTQTRRVVKPYGTREIVNLHEAHPDLGYSGRNDDPASFGYSNLDDGAPADLATWAEALCPYGQSGDRLWVRECFAAWWITATGERSGVMGYRADVHDPDWDGCGQEDPWWLDAKWEPSIHMPRWASRILLEITGVRVERLQNISEADAIAEGITHFGDGGIVSDDDGRHYGATAREAYAHFWEAINGRGSWDANSWVWVVEFQRLGQSNG